MDGQVVGGGVVALGVGLLGGGGRGLGEGEFGVAAPGDEEVVGTGGLKGLGS